jgi:hypothetical protein
VRSTLRSAACLLDTSCIVYPSGGSGRLIPLCSSSAAACTDLGKLESDGLYPRRRNKKAPKLCTMELRYGKKTLPDGTRQLSVLLPPPPTGAEALMPFSPTAPCANNTRACRKLALTHCCLSRAPAAAAAAPRTYALS